MSRSRDFQVREFKAMPTSSMVIGTSRCTFQPVRCTPLDLSIPQDRAALRLPEYKEQKSRPKTDSIDLGLGIAPSMKYGSTVVLRLDL